MAGYIPRALEPIVTEVSAQYPVVFLSGPRQVGKTTLLKKLMEGTKRAYLTLDDIEVRQQAKQNPRLFLETHHPPLLIDEVQYAPELLNYIKIIVDERGVSGDYWVTGSQVFRLMRGVQESLAGRVAILNLTSLSQSERQRKQNYPFIVDESELLKKQKERTCLGSDKLLQDILRGSFPKVVADSTMNSSIFYSSYLSSYIQRDIRELSAAPDEFKFLDFIRSAAIRSSQTVNFAGLARDASIDQKTAKAWLNMLETLGVVTLLRSYSNNLLTRTVKTPKLYFFDTGLVAHLAKITTIDELKRSNLLGALFENYVVMEIVKSYHNAAIESPLYYYRDSNQNEIDVVIQSADGLSPIEIKNTTNPGLKAIRGFRALEKSALPLGKGAVICQSPHLGILNDSTYIVPISLV